jgi:all-trans-8'-apo-beta-carotenal 15,15'-oxygenase
MVQNFVRFAKRQLLRLSSAKKVSGLAHSSTLVVCRLIAEASLRKLQRRENRISKMISQMNRRSLLAVGAGLSAAALSPAMVYATPLPWSLAVDDVNTDVAPRTLRRLHGSAPAGLQGVLYRNGPAKWRRPGGDASHWFDGDGLMRRFAIRDGQVSLSARFADTHKRRTDTAANAVVTPGFGSPIRKGADLRGPDDASPANISVLPMGDEIWALWEAGSPLRLDANTLESRGHQKLSPTINAPFLAHPKVEPNGRIWNLGIEGKDAVVWRLAPSGALEMAERITLPRPSYVHDFTATDRHLVLVLQPWLQVHATLPFMKGFAWQPEAGVQVLVLDKDDLSNRRIYDLPPFFFFHLGDAWNDNDGTIRFDVCLEPDVTFVTQGACEVLKSRVIAGMSPRMALVTLKPDGTAGLEILSTTAEFPRTDSRFAGLKRQRTIHVSGYEKARAQPTRLAVHDWGTGHSDAFDFGDHQHVEEFVFVPRPGGSAEMDGWLLGSTLNLKAASTELHVMDARHVARGPLVSWGADLALPVSFHGAFVQAV